MNASLDGSLLVLSLDQLNGDTASPLGLKVGLYKFLRLARGKVEVRENGDGPDPFLMTRFNVVMLIG